MSEDHPVKRPAACPECREMHTAGKFVKRTIEGKECYSPGDIVCRCGAHLRYVVPIFNLFGGPGYKWEKIKKAEWSVDPEAREGGGKLLGHFEADGKDEDSHLFTVIEVSNGKLLFGGECNVGFLESGCIFPEGDETLDETLQELFADLSVYYTDGPRYVTRIIHNERM